jgi:hypothetical protein
VRAESETQICCCFVCSSKRDPNTDKKAAQVRFIPISLPLPHPQQHLSRSFVCPPFPPYSLTRLISLFTVHVQIMSSTETPAPSAPVEEVKTDAPAAEPAVVETPAATVRTHLFFPYFHLFIFFLHFFFQEAPKEEAKEVLFFIFVSLLSSSSFQVAPAAPAVEEGTTAPPEAPKDETVSFFSRSRTHVLITSLSPPPPRPRPRRKTGPRALRSSPRFSP